MILKAKQLLKTVFGYDDFVSLQEQIIQNILQKKDTLAVMPTGGGKSLCYQLPSLIFDGLTVVVSPLISLMKDQLDQLIELNISATMLNSALSSFEYNNNVQLLKNNEIKLLYLAPETLMKENIISLLLSIQVDCIAIDEAHCISAWGHDFRPDYRKIAEIRPLFKDAVCIALTATATKLVRDDIKSILSLDSSQELVASFDRENLFLQIIPKDNPLKQVMDFISRFENRSGIIYCSTRKHVNDLSKRLIENNISAKPYHAGLSESERSITQEEFTKDNIQIIVATVAFGMGINKSDVRFVLHLNLPQNIESYYQEIGRAGRDGLRADCLLLLSYADIHTIRFFMEKKNEDEQRMANISLNAFLQYAQADVCRRIVLLGYFGEKYKKQNCNMCDNCLRDDEDLVDITILAQKFLSCVKRTGELFGATHIVDVLRGSQSKKVMKFNHHKLSTYGIGMEHSKQQWLHLSRQFLHKGLMVQDMKFGGLQLLPPTWDLFKGNLKIMGILLPTEPESDSKPATYEQKIKTANILDHDKELFEILRRKRKELADEHNIPPYVIFSDRSLIEMAAYFPHQNETLLPIHGVGEAKIKKYGSIFLPIISEYCQNNNITEQPKSVLNNRQPIHRSISKKRHEIVAEAYNSGCSVQNLMGQYNVKSQTILSHLYKYVQEGNKIRAGELLSLSDLSDDKKQEVLKAYQEIGHEMLRPVFDLFNQQISYEDLHIIRLYYILVSHKF